MSTQIETGEREVVLLEDAHIRPMMGLDVLEPLPSRTIPYAQVDPFILVHEAVVPITPERASMDTKHPHRGFDNLWYLLAGEASTGHSTGPGGAMERAAADRIPPEAPNGQRCGGMLKGSAKTSSERARPEPRCAASCSG